MKKKIKDLTIAEIVNICKKCYEKELCDECPFRNIGIISCAYVDNEAQINDLGEQEIEVDDE